MRLTSLPTANVRLMKLFPALTLEAISSSPGSPCITASIGAAAWLGSKPPGGQIQPACRKASPRISTCFTLASGLPAITTNCPATGATTSDVAGTSPGKGR